MSEEHHYNEDEDLIDKMEFELANYLSGEYDAPQWRGYVESNQELFNDLEGAAGDGCGENGKPYPEDLCRRWAEHLGYVADTSSNPSEAEYDTASFGSLRRGLINSYIVAMADGRMSYEEGGRKAVEAYRASYEELINIGKREYGKPDADVIDKIRYQMVVKMGCKAHRKDDSRN